MNQTHSPKPWYREPWPWIIMSGPAIVVVAGIATAVLAFRGFDGPTGAEYYKDGLAVNQELGRAHKGSELGVTGIARFESLQDGDAVRVVVRATQALPAEPALKLRLVHPGTRELDREAMLSRSEVSADGQEASFVGRWHATREFHSPRPVNWTLILETPSWRVDDVVQTASGGEFRIQR